VELGLRRPFFRLAVCFQGKLMNAGEPARDGRHRAAAARPVSPSNTVVVVGVVPVRTVVAVKRRRRERSPSPLSGDPPPPPVQVAGPAPKKAKSYESIKKEIRDLLEENLMGAADDDIMVVTLRTLFRHFPTAGAAPQDRQQQTEECRYQRAITEWNGCHVVLAALRRELHKADTGDSILPNLRVVLYALFFLQRWNFHAERCDVMSRLDGIDAVVRAMRAFRHDAKIQLAAILCFGHYTRHSDAKRCREVVEKGVIPDIFRALMARKYKNDTPKCGALLLGRLCDVAGPRHFDGLVEQGALEAVAKVVRAHKNSKEPDSPKVLSACRKLMAKLV
jgi:hypothetical protein